MLDGNRRNFADQMPGGSGDLTLAELQEMASRQQQHMEAQQQVLVAKEQRLKFLRQQEARHAQLASEGDRIRKMRERVESQELKLKKLRALRGQAEQYRASNGNLNGELDAVKAIFNEKEKELSMAVARVDRLNRQLQELRNSNNSSGANPGPAVDNKQAAVAAELDKLRKELLIRNKLNEQQSNTISAKEKMLNQRREEVARMDARIRELQQRLKKRQAQEMQMKQKQHQQQQQQQQQQPQHQQQAEDQMKSGPGAATNTSGQTNPSSSLRGASTMQPYIQYAPQNVAKDDLYSKTGNFLKQDPKYQTLPARVKYGAEPGVGGSGGGGGVGGKLNKPAELNNNNSEAMEEYQLPTVLPHQPPSQQGRQAGLSAAGSRLPSNTGPVLSYGLAQQKSNNQMEPAYRPSPTSQASGFVPQGSKLPVHQAPSASVMGAGDGPVGSKSTGPSPLNPIINIHEEERQAGSGQSSPASSEASTSSGGIQVKGDNEVNTAPIGPVSAMIERLNRTGGQHQHPPQQFTPHGQDRSTFTKTQGHPTSSLSTTQTSNVSSSTSSRNQMVGPHPAGASQPTPQMLPSATAEGSVAQHGNSNSSSSSSGVFPPPPATPMPSSPNPSSSGPPHLNQKPAPTYRYASKNQIANTYMGRLGSAVMDKYQQNLNQIYRNLDTGPGPGPGPASSPPHGAGAQANASSTAALQGGGMVQQQSVEARTSFSHPASSGNKDTTDHPQFGVVSSPNYPDIASDKGSFKLNTPKQVRRRHSDSENEDLNKALQERQQLEQQEKQHPSQNQASGTPSVGDPSGQGRQEAPVTEPESKSSTAKPSVGTGKNKQDSSKDKTDSSKKGKESSSSSSSSSPLTSDPSSNTAAKETIPEPPSNDPSQTKPTPEDSPGGAAGQGKTEPVVMRRTKSNLKKQGSRKSANRVSFDPLALLLDASLEGELDLVRKVAVQVDDVSTPNDEGITALHNAICAGHYEIVKVLVEFGCDVNSPDSDGWTPLHCAASCNNLPMVKFLVEHGACVFATTISDQETAADKCEEEEDGYEGCSDYLYSIQEKLGITNGGEVYGVFDYQATKTDELSFQIGDKIVVLRKGDETEKEWWWARLAGNEGYIPRNMLGLHPRVIPGPKEVSEC